MKKISCARGLLLLNLFLLIKSLLASSFFLALSSVRWLLAYVKQILRKKFIISETNAFKLLMSKYLHPCRVSEHTFLSIPRQLADLYNSFFKNNKTYFEERNGWDRHRKTERKAEVKDYRAISSTSDSLV